MLIAALRDGAQTTPDQPFLISRGGVVTYSEALPGVERLAVGLNARGILRFAITCQDPVDIVLLLCAASAAGAEPCVYPRGLGADEVADFAAEFDHDTVVGDLSAPGTPDIVDLRDLAANGAVDHSTAADDATVLILTTGTTGRPKGARHMWSRLMPDRERAGPADSRWLLAYNLNQFAGLQVLVHVLAAGATLVVPPSIQPRDAVAAMRDFGVTHASATPTFWRIASSMLDRSTARTLSLRQITLGGEAVPEALLATLRDLFPDARLSQIYASTELGSAVSVRDGKPGLPLSVLERGDGSGAQFRVSDGELWVRSRVGMLGYHGQDDVDAGWRPTGDLVAVHGDRLEFVGRTSEVINVGGVKVHPLPIEAVVARVQGVEVARVYGRPNAVTGEIVAVEVVAQAGSDPDDLKDRIRQECADLPAASQPRLIKLVDSLSLRDNKVLRRKEPQP